MLPYKSSSSNREKKRFLVQPQKSSRQVNGSSKRGRASERERRKTKPSFPFLTQPQTRTDARLIKVEIKVAAGRKAGRMWLDG